MPPTKSLPRYSVFATKEIYSMTRRELIAYTLDLIKAIPNREKRRATRKRFVQHLDDYPRQRRMVCALTIYNLEKQL